MTGLQWFVLPSVTLPTDTLHPLAFEDCVMQEMTREKWENLEALERRAEWDKKHPRCEVCGQFIGSVSHFWQDYFGEWDHV